MDIKLKEVFFLNLLYIYIYSSCAGSEGGQGVRTHSGKSQKYRVS